MAWADAKTTAQNWAEKNLPQDLRGQVLQLVVFENDRHAAFFYPDRTAKFQHMVNNSIGRLARKRGALTNSVVITPERYREWLEVQQLEDSDAQRLSFIESFHHLTRAD